jgi:hypothetical protein
VKKKSQSEDKEQQEREEQKRKERLEVYQAWAQDEERLAANKLAAARAIASGLL